jgi:hypothetical protein
MIYLKSVLVGIAAAIAAAGLWIFGVFIAPLVIPFLISRITNSAGAGIGAAYVGSTSILVAAVVGFLAGFYWQFRRLSTRRRQSL